MTVSIICVLVWGISGPSAQACSLGEMSKANVIEQVNTVWEQIHWTRTKAVHLLQRKNSVLLAITVSLLPDSPLSTLQSVLLLKARVHLLPCSFQTD